MGIFFDDGKDKAVKAARLAKKAHDDLEDSADLLKDISRKLYKIAQELPKNAPASTTKSIFRTMKNLERGTNRTLIHMKKLDTHIRHVENVLRRNQ